MKKLSSPQQSNSTIPSSVVHHSAHPPSLSALHMTNSHGFNTKTGRNEGKPGLFTRQLGARTEHRNQRKQKAGRREMNDGKRDG